MRDTGEQWRVGAHRASGRGEGCSRRGDRGGEEEVEGFGGLSEPVEVRGVAGGRGRGSVEVLHIMER